jgi:biopolymer transport protein ExbB/TolQ
MSWEMFIQSILTLATVLGAISAYRSRHVEEDKGESEAAKNYADITRGYAEELRNIRSEMASLRLSNLQEIKQKDEKYLAEKIEMEDKFRKEVLRMTDQISSFRTELLQSMVKTRNLENQVRKLEEQVLALGGTPIKFNDLDILGEEVK